MGCKSLWFCAVPIAVVLSACGGSSGTKSAPPPAATSTTVHVAKAAATEPSESAQMICSDDVHKELAGVIGVQTTQPLKPTWVDHVYACDFVYPDNAKMTLSVKELSSAEETTAYFDDLARRLGKKDELQLGQGAFTTADGSVVTRKDFKVMLVDVKNLPAQFGDPIAKRGDIAIDVANTIMGCWTGA